MDAGEIRKLSDGANQSGVRAHNERLILSVIQRHGEMPGSDIAKLTGLSAQTVSNILRKLEAEQFVLRRAPKRGRVGKPSVPMTLNPDGALSFGLKIGRRSADLVVMNLAGEVLGASQTTFRYPMPGEVFGYLADGMADLARDLDPGQRDRLCGIGIAAPSEIWAWTEVLGAPEDFTVWREIDVAQEVARIEAGLLTPQLESLDLVYVVGSACDSVRNASEIALAQDIAPDLPFVRGDPILLHHILANLIDNGLRHARARVIVAAKADGAAVRLRVSDDGPGVPAHERTRIFDRFARGEGGDTRQGSGLGLAIVKGFADAMGMSVTIDDAPGGGACFTLVLPQAGRAGP